MASLMTLEVLTPDQYLMKRKDIAYVLLNTVTGGIGILANHGPLIAVLGEGTLKLQDGNNHVILLYVEGGFAEVKDNKVIILTPKAELAEHIDVKKWEAVRDEAAARLTRPGVLTDIEHTEKTLRRAEARLKTANLMGHVAPYEWETNCLQHVLREGDSHNGFYHQDGCKQDGSTKGRDCRAEGTSRGNPYRRAAGAP